MVAAVVHDGVEGDDEVPDPGGADVAASEEGADTDGKSGHQHSVHWVTVAGSGRYGSSELVMVLVVFIEGGGMEESVAVVAHHFKDQDAPEYVQHHPSVREIDK